MASDAAPSRPVEYFGPIRRCRTHRMADGCECGWSDCLPELQPYQPAMTYEFTTEEATDGTT